MCVYYATQQQTVTVTVTVRRDTTPPQVTSVSPARAADANGWYNHAVALTFAGSDATSGIATCGAPTYSGPDSGSVAVVGVCRDVAGNTSAPVTFALKYDAHSAGGQRVARAGPRCKRLVLEADHRLLHGQRRDLGDRVMHGPRHLHRAGTPPPRASAAAARTLPATAPLRRRRFPYDSTAPSAVAAPGPAA